MKKILSSITILFVVLIFSGCEKESEKAKNQEEITNAESQVKLNEQQQLDELQKSKDEQIRLAEEKKSEEEKQKILSAQNKNMELDKCNDRKSTCENKISKIKNINYEGEQIHVSTIDDSSKQIKTLKKSIDQWESRKKTCNTGSDSQIKDCKDILDKLISEGEDDIKEIERLTEKAEKEMNKIATSVECSGYKNPCE